MLKKLNLKFNQNRVQTWYWLIFFATLLIGIFTTWYVVKSQDAEMRNNLVTYATTISQAIDWRPHANLLNTNPKQLVEADFAELHQQLNAACKANQDCHFIYLLYRDENKVKFLLDASSQPPSEISHLGDIHVDASNDLQQAIINKHALIEGPVTDHWGTWITASVPIEITIKTPHFVMLNIDVAVKGWNQKILKKALVPIFSTLLFLTILGGLIYQNKKREKLVAQLFSSTNALAEIANNDALTGLPNRRLLEDRMSQAFKFAQREETKVAVFFLDLDYFKLANDTHGHEAGDQLLKLVAARLKSLLRADDSIARVGGDEFIILLPSIETESQTIIAAEKIINALAMPFSLLGLATPSQMVQIGVSVGIAVHPDHGATPNDLIKHADIAMYAAKRKGRNCYAMYDSEWQ